MRKPSLILAAGLLMALAVASPVSAERLSFNNWHVHNGLPGGRPAVFFPAILGLSLSDYQADPSRWAYCPNATDKPLLGDGIVDGSKSAAGVCMNETTVVHILAVGADQTPPAGWTQIPGSSAYYRLTMR